MKSQILLSLPLLSRVHAFPAIYYLTPRQSNQENGVDLSQLFSETVVAKILRTATQSIDQLPDRFPDNIPTEDEKYIFSDISAWTSGFFPGSLYALLERNVKYPSHFPTSTGRPQDVYEKLLDLGNSWADPLHEQAYRTDTHDMGFLIVPALRRDWELTGNRKSLDSVVNAAHSLATRYDSRVSAIRSWDSLRNKRHNITDKESNFLVIIDSVCNLDLLFYAGHHTGNQTLIDIDTTHAHTVIRDIVRDDHSTFHCCNIDPQTDKLKFQETVQGYKDWSTWSRGQAWGIVGYTQTYQWTKDPVFLGAAQGLADYFVKRLKNASHTHPYVPLWDFDAPLEGGVVPPRDTSAGMIAAYGMLLLHQALQGSSPYYKEAQKIAAQTIDLSFADSATVTVEDKGDLGFSPVRWESILMNATINNNEYATPQSNNTGLVYADYYFLQFGNLLLEIGLV